MTRLSKAANSAEIVEWLKSPGQMVAAGEAVVRVLSEKATVDLEAPASGVLLAVLTPAGREVETGAILGWIGQAGERPPVLAPGTSARPLQPKAEVIAPVVAGDAGGTPAAGVRATPAARRLARERGVELAGLVGSGPGGVITAWDVEEAGGPAELSPAEAALEPGERAEPLSGIQRVMLERMTLNRREVAQATTVAEVDVSEVLELRRSAPATLTAWVVLAASRALSEYPLLNASLRGRELVYHAGVHVGVSVETDAGLLVPVIRDAHQRTLAQVHKELERLVAEARAGRLGPADMVGATFTVTNSGVLGSVLYTPMITPPQSAILGMGRATKVAVVREERIVARTMMYLCLSYDHRFIPGGVAVRYLQRVRAYLEAPATLVWDAGS